MESLNPFSTHELTLQTTTFVTIFGRVELKFKALCHRKQIITCSVSLWKIQHFTFAVLVPLQEQGNPDDEVSGPAATHKRMPSPRTQSKLLSLTTKKLSSLF